MSGSGIEHLSQLIDPDTKGIIWLTDGPLEYDTPGSYEINYLLNGTLTKSIADKEEDAASKSAKSNFFLGDNFGRRFFVVHRALTDKSDFKGVFKQLEIARPFMQEGGQVFILNKSKNTAGLNVLKELRAKVQNVTFEHLTI